MAASAPADRSLDRFLADLGDQLAALGGETVLVGAADVAEPEAIETFRKLGLLNRCAPGGAVICDGCDHGCTMDVQYSASAGSEPCAFIVCDKRDDIGRVPVNSDHLKRWCFGFDDLTTFVAGLLGTDGPVSAVPGARFRDLGRFRNGGSSIEARLCLDASGNHTFPGLRIVTGSMPEEGDAAVMSLETLCRFRQGRPSLNKAALRRVLKARYGDPRIAWEIRFDGGEIVLVNHVTDDVSPVARPNFNSSNDNAFQHLYEHSGKTFSLTELQDAINDRSIADLHKMVENLKFHGPLKSAFFRVSQNAIAFERTATLGKLVTLRLDPKVPF